MPEHDRSPRRWTYVVVAAWTVGGIVALLTWRDTVWWLAMAVPLCLAGVTITAMRRIPEVRRRTPSDDLETASIFQLSGIATKARFRVSRWIDNGLDDEARTHAEKALERLDAIVTLIRRCDTQPPNEEMRVAVRATVQSVEYSTSEKPRGAADWRAIKKTMEVEYEALDYAVTQRGPHR